MTETLADQALTDGTNQTTLTVSELSRALKSTVEDAFGYVRVRGELSGVKHHTSGHLYFSLKDNQAVLQGVCWRGSLSRLRFKPEDGLEVVATGRITTYEGRSQYQIVAEFMEVAGVGALMAMLEKRKALLAAEGLFEASRKRPLPFLPHVIGVITSPTGAVIRDILHRITDRFPVRVILWPVAVQGEGAAEQVTKAIQGFNALDGNTIPIPDVIIVARGGGSIEDLWPFNDENLVRATAHSRIPIISAVGHETDTTLIDFASDRRAPTPTAAAEIVVPVKTELQAYVSDLAARMHQIFLRHMRQLEQQLLAMARGLIHPRQKLETMAQRLDDMSERLQRVLPNYIHMKQQKIALFAVHLKPALLLSQLERFQQRLQLTAQLLESFHVEKVLSRGFAIVHGAGGKLVSRAAQIQENDAINLTFQDGKRHAVVDGKRIPARRKKDPISQGQGSLFED